MPRKGIRDEWNVEDLEPICLFITCTRIEGPDEQEMRKAVSGLLSSFRFLRTPNPLVWFFLGRWKPEMSEEDGDRIPRLVDNLKSVKGNALVTVSHAWTNLIQYQQLSWKAWREIIS